MNKRLFILLSFYFGLYTALAQTDHWETILFSSHVWQYHPGNTPVDPNWKSVSYDDSAWLSGMGGIGYGDGDDKTVIDPVLSLFYRRAFDVPDASAINQALLHIDFDDAFVAYLNGVEIARANIGVKGDNPAYNQPADGLREITGTPEGFLVDSIQSLIVTGTNVLAVQVHNQDISSSDLSSNTWFSVGISTSASYFSPTPAWFRAPVEFTSSSLPIVSITTSGQEILSDMRIVAQLDLYQPVNGLANLTDTATTYRISIEKRGSSSLWFPKNSYSLETQTALGTNLNVGLLGMPPENDWILYAPYSDKSLIRNVLTYDLGNQLGQYAPRTRFCEVVINGEYKGIYILTEKIKRDLNRVNIARLDSTEISGDNLTGGYIVKIDRPKAGLSHDWYSEISGPASQDPGHRIGFVVEYPGHKDILPEQLAYISNYVKNFENALSGSFFTDWNWGYKNYIDVNSFIDFWLMNEITK
ncbi:MAG: CotH kinase family protein, partial [Cyclobacteriaceae bacterium]|nr:CotH kinase family protein [Cyclobacteriaceae bacterium]